MQKSSHQPASPELPRCKRSQTEKQDQFSHCVNSPNESHNVLAESTPCSNSLKQADDLHRDHGVLDSSPRQGCNSSCSSGSCCTSKSLRVKKRHTLQPTEPGQSWQARCSNFIINLPATFSEKLFGPRTNCEALKNGKRTICNDDLRINETQPAPKDASKLSSWDQSSKKSVKSRASSLADHGCHKNIGTDNIFLEKANQIDLCCSRTSQSVEEVVPCGESIRKSKKSSTTCKKLSDESGKSCDDSFAWLEMSGNHSDDIHLEGSETYKPRFKRGLRSQISSSISVGKKRGKTCPRFPNWPTILSEKLFGLRNEKVCCVIDNEAKLAKETNGVANSSEIVSEAGLPSAAKKGRLMLKKYTISQTPEAVEETLCFEILASEQLTVSKTKLQRQTCMKMTSDSRQKLKTIQERNEVLKKCLGMSRPRTLERCMKTTENFNRSNSRKTQQLKKKNSTEHISLSSLMMKLLSKHRVNKDVCNVKKCHRNMASAQSGKKRVQHERKCAFKQRTKTISRKYASTSIHKHRNKSVKCSKYIGKDSRQNKAVSCCLEQNVSLDHCTLDFANVSGEAQTQRKILSDFPSEPKDSLQHGSTRTYLSEDNLENVKDLCKKGTQVKIRLKKKSSGAKKYQSCDSCESSKIRSCMKSGVSQVIGQSCRSKSKEFCYIVLHRKKPEPKSCMQKKYCKRILGLKKCACEIRSQTAIEHNDVQLACRGRYGGEMISKQRETEEKGTCMQRYPDISKNGFENYDPLRKSEASQLENYENDDSILTPVQRGSGKRCNRKQSPSVQTRVCKKLILKENDISHSTKDKTPQILMEGTRRMFVIAGENICVKMFHNRETCTDDLPGAAHYCQSTKNCSPSSQKTEKNSFTNVIRNSVSQDTVGCCLQSRPPEEGPIIEQNGNSSLPKQPENGMRIRVDCEECVGSSCEDDACWIRPKGISEGEDILEVERDAGTVFSSLWQKACRECQNIVCGGETCLYKALIKSESKEALGISNEDEFCQSQSIDRNSSLKVNGCSPSLVAAKVCSREEKDDSINKPSDKDADTNDNQQLPNGNPKKSDQLDGFAPKIPSSEKRGSWVTSPRKDLEVTKPESRNIINSYYSQREKIVVSRREARNDEHAKVKTGKVQRESSVSEKNITKARKPLQRIENVKQVGCTANVVIKDNKSKKQDAVEKENSIINEKTQYSQDESVSHNDAKNYAVQNVIIDNLNLPDSSMAIRPADASSMQKLTEMDSVNPETPSPTLKIPKESKPLGKNKTPKRVSGSNTRAPESSSTELRENSRKSLLKKGNIGTGTSTTNAKGTTKKVEKIAENAESESSNRLTRSIDTCDTKSSEGHKELRHKAPAYILDKENVKARNLQVEISSIAEQDIPNSSIDKGTSWIAKGRRNSKSSKSPSLQRNSERRENDKSRNSAAAKGTEENRHTNGNQSKSEMGNKKNERDRKSTPLKLLSQIDSDIDASNSTQERVDMNADLFASALMDGKNNIKSYRDLQSAAEENSNSNRISASKDEGLRKSGTATTQSKSKVLNSSESSKTSAKTTPGKSKNDKKFSNFQESVSGTTETASIAGKDKTENMLRTFPGTVNVENSNEGLTADSGLGKVDASVEVNNTEASRSTTCKKNGIHERNFKPRKSATNSEEAEPLKTQHSLENQIDLKKNSIALSGYNLEEGCTIRTLENAALPKNSSKKTPPVCISGKESNNERPSLKLRMPPYQRKNGTQTSSSRTSSNSNQKTKQGSHADDLRLGSPQFKSHEDRSAAESRNCTKNLEKIEKQEIYCSTKRKDKQNALKEGITEIGDSLEPKVKCKTVRDLECNDTKSKRLCKSFQKSINEETKQLVQQNNHPDKLTSGRIISDSSDQNCRFTSDLKRFLDQGQDFFTSKKMKNSNRTTLCSDGNQELMACGSCESNNNETCCETTEFCKSVDSEKLKKSLKLCDEDRTSNNSISSLQRVYSTLKTILNKTKNVEKCFINVKESKETQTYTPVSLNSRVPP